MRAIEEWTCKYFGSGPDSAQVKAVENAVTILLGVLRWGSDRKSGGSPRQSECVGNGVL